MTGKILSPWDGITWVKYSPLMAMALSVLLVSGCEQEQGPQAQAVAAPETAAEFLARASRALGNEQVTRIAFSANGWEACLGQPWNINDGWARWSITDYHRVIDYKAFNSLQSAQRQAGMDPDKLGGCGAQPGAAAQNQQTSVNLDSGWEQQLQIHLTPSGFLALAESNGTQFESDGEGVALGVNVEHEGIRYHLTGSFGDDALLDHVVTYIDNSVYGDMAYEAEFSQYREFAGQLFPAQIIQKQGGYTTLNLAINNVIPDTDENAVPPPREARNFGGAPQSDLPAFEEIGEGIYALHGAYQSVVMEFAEFSVVLDGLQNDARADEIIRLTREIIPDKPIAYVLATHNHFDHASGLRQFIAEGATIITHDINVEFFQSALSAPRQLNPDYISEADNEVKLMGVSDFYALDDGVQRVEFHKLDNSLHADDMLVAYIPAIRTIVEADVLQPWINPVFGGGQHPFLIYLADELDRLGLDVEQFVPVHRPPMPPLMSKDELMETIGRN